MNNQTAIAFAPVAAAVNAALTLSTVSTLKPCQLDSASFENYFYAGKAEFTVLNTNTGARMTFRVKKSKKNASRFFIEGQLLGDGDKGYVQLGSIYHKKNFYISENCPELPTSVSIRSVLFLIKNAAQISNWPNIEVYHKNHCGRCGRKLTTPESVVTGMGPECARREAAEGIVPAGQQRTVGSRPNANAAVRLA